MSITDFFTMFRCTLLRSACCHAIGLLPSTRSLEPMGIDHRTHIVAVLSCSLDAFEEEFSPVQHDIYTQCRGLQLSAS
jgi:hypothetical protein